MEQPKRLRRKVVNMEEYLEENQAPLDPTQHKRIKHMNKDMWEQLDRIKQAWADRNEEDKFDDIYIEEITRIITDSEDDVRETIMESRRVMNMLNVSPNSATCEAIEMSGTEGGQRQNGGGDNDGKEDNTDAKGNTSQNIHMRRVDTEDRQIDKSHQIEVHKKEKKESLKSVQAAVEMLMAAQGEHNRNRRN